MTEPNATALLLTAAGVLMLISVLLSRFPNKAGIPIAIFFVAVGMVAGSDGLGGIDFEDYELTFRLGTAALVFILFDGGLNTQLSSVREGIRPAAVLATVGVVMIAGLTAVAAKLLGFAWPTALLLGAIVSSTDAAAVFSVLRGSGIALKKRVGATLELESGLNDPMAVILTLGMTQALASEAPSVGTLILGAVIQMVVGVGLGFAFGLGGRWLLKHARLPAGGLYPVLTVALAMLAFGVPTLLQGSGFMAVYISAIMLGNNVIRYRSGVLRVHDSLAWLSHVTMFLLLGLLVFPSQLAPVALQGLGVALALAFVARPVAILLLLWPFNYTWTERFYIAWIGLRGAVPIILATFPILAGLEVGREIFNVVFFVVVISAFLPGTTVGWLTRRLKLTADAPPSPPAALEINSTQLLSGEVTSFYIGAASAACGAKIADLPFPDQTTVAVIIRGTELMAPRGTTELQEGDHVYVFHQLQDLPFLGLMFGLQEGS